MKQGPPNAERRNVPILTGQGATGIIGWTMASPTVVLTFLAVSLDLPVFLAGALVAIQQAAGTVTDVFLSGWVARLLQRKRAIATTNILTALCFLLAIAAAGYGSKSLTVIAFVGAVFVIGFVQEIQSLMITGFLSDHVESDSRMRMYYMQMALGGLGAIGLTWAAHRLMLDKAPLERHLAVVSIAVACFVVSGLSMLAVSEPQGKPQAAASRSFSPIRFLAEFITNARKMMKMRWFRQFMLVRMMCALVSLSVPFFALLAAATHHSSSHGLAYLVISSAAGLAVAAPLWRVLNGFSNRVVMVTAATLVAMTAGGLLMAHFGDINHDVHLHAAALFLAVIAVTGLRGTVGLFFMEVAPKEHRVTANAVSKSIVRLVLVVLSALLAAVAHSSDVVWAVVAIALISLVTAFVSFRYVKDQRSTSTKTQEEPWLLTH